MQKETINDVKIATMQKDIDDINDAKLPQRLSTIETNIKFGKWVVSFLVIAMVSRFVIQTDAGFKELKAELTAVRNDLKYSSVEHKEDNVRLQEQLNALALAAVKQNSKPEKQFELKEYLKSLVEKDDIKDVVHNPTWKNNNDIMVELKKSFNDKDLKQLEKIRHQQQQK